MGTGYESIGRYFHLSFANLFAFLIGVGLPITAVWLRQIIASVKEWRQNALSSEQENSETRVPWILRHDEALDHVRRWFPHHAPLLHVLDAVYDGGRADMDFHGCRFS